MIKNVEFKVLENNQTIVDGIYNSLYNKEEYSFYIDNIKYRVKFDLNKVMISYESELKQCLVLNSKCGRSIININNHDTSLEITVLEFKITTCSFYVKYYLNDDSVNIRTVSFCVK